MLAGGAFNRHGATPAYPHPDLEPVLADTYGVVIRHEQIIEIFQGQLSVSVASDGCIWMQQDAQRALLW
ncbi:MULTISPECIES: hypothetical protein [unclassified Streptomyces]|uniref:hypothetical protein n=1 Tax=Streptomyces sp. NBC_00500 TaxID=2975762 RepID=UPI002E818345|nr:hypothetical protein [Streptomyces sp. NBC_00589]WUB32579.1 hypothetical protein OHA51_48285 [Streptomyces sp. NBC_00589]